jgi:hypothetical protein
VQCAGEQLLLQHVAAAYCASRVMACSSVWWAAIAALPAQQLGCCSQSMWLLVCSFLYTAPYAVQWWLLGPAAGTSVRGFSRVKSTGVGNAALRCVAVR